MWRRSAKFVVKALLGIAACVWIVVPVSKWGVFLIFAGAIGVFLILGFILYALEEDDSKAAQEQFRKPNY